MTEKVFYLTTVQNEKEVYVRPRLTARPLPFASR